jgi:kynurenine 3-monooxygenase
VGATLSADLTLDDRHAIFDLSSIEMRHSVTTPAHKLKRMVDNLLFSLTCRTPVTLTDLGALPPGVTFPAGRPRGWLPLYTMVTFRPDISYAKARRKAAEQAWVTNKVSIVGSVAFCVGASVLLVRMALYCRKGRDW